MLHQKLGARLQNETYDKFLLKLILKTCCISNTVVHVLCVKPTYYDGCYIEYMSQYFV